MSKNQVTQRWSERTLARIEALAAAEETTATAVVERAVREMFERKFGTEAVVVIEPPEQEAMKND